MKTQTITTIALAFTIVGCGKTNENGEDEKTMRKNTFTSAKQLALGMLMYAQDNDGVMPPKFPTQKEWQKVIYPYFKHEFKSDNLKGGDFVQNPATYGISTKGVDQTLILGYEENAWDDGKKCYFTIGGDVKFLSSSEKPKMTP
ncbi:MAG: hypothetical protein WCG75_07565 [Armatimonadota bacterium]